MYIDRERESSVLFYMGGLVEKKLHNDTIKRNRLAAGAKDRTTFKACDDKH